MKDKLIPKSKFPFVLGFSALLIALCAAAFSVYGISTLFAGAAVSAMVMASSLEIGKLVGVTFLYRYWHKCNVVLKVYLSVASVVLMAVTSLGIFGYLSSAYQKSSIEYGVTQEKIKTTEEQKTYYQDKISASKDRIKALQQLRSAQENRMSTVVTNQNLTRNPLQLKQLQQQTSDEVAATDKDIKDQNDSIQTSIDSISKINDQVNTMKLGTAQKKDVQTFKFVADAFGISLDKVARWFIGLLIFVFDPLAVCLVLAYNVAVYKKEDDDVYDQTPTTKIPKTETPKITENNPKVVESSAPNEVPVLKEEPKKEVITDAKKDDSSTNGFFNSYFKK